MKRLDPGSVVQGTCDGSSFTLAEGPAARRKTLNHTLVEFNPEYTSEAGYGYCAAQVNVYNAAMQTTLELLEKAPESLIAAGVRSAFVPRSRAVIAADRGCGSVTTVLEPAREPAMDGFCLWCDRTFTPLTTGGSAQKFCCTRHRQQFAARRWTMRAIEVGLLSIDCLRASHTSVHAA